MKFKELSIKGAFKIEVDNFKDHRGSFGRIYCKNEFLENDTPFDVVQANAAFNEKKFTIRGLHYQIAPQAENKLIYCTRGSILDVIVDLRKKSETFKNWCSVELTDKDSYLIYVPEGCAHGYQSLEDKTEIFYMVSSFYSPEHERGIRWDDPNFNIKWKEEHNVILSKKDKNWPDYIG